MADKNKKDVKKEEKKEKHYVKLIYKDVDDSIQEVVLEIDKTDYYDNLSYEENLQQVVSMIHDDGGFWVENKIIPFHRLRAAEPHKKDNEKPIKKDFKKPHRRQHGRKRNDSNNSGSQN